MKTLCLGALTCVALVAPALANEYIEYPVNRPGYPFQRSYLSGQAVGIPPYPCPFPVRIYTTPPQQPYYNVPPYPVVAPY